MVLRILLFFLINAIDDSFVNSIVNCIDVVKNCEVEALSSSVAIDADTDATEYWAFLYVAKF